MHLFCHVLNRRTKKSYYGYKNVLLHITFQLCREKKGDRGYLVELF